MQDSFGTCVDLMRAVGKLTEGQMDELDVPSSTTGDSRQVPKDQRVLLHQQRSSILTEEVIANQYQAYKGRKSCVKKTSDPGGKECL